MNRPVFPRVSDFFLASPRRDPRVTAHRVDRQLRQLVTRIDATVPFYRELWREAGFDPRSMTGTGDLPAIPTVDKQRIVDAGAGARDPRVEHDPRRFMKTSGTSGCSIEVRRTLHELRTTRRGYLRSLLLAGARPWHRYATMASPWLQTQRGLFVRHVIKTRHYLPLDTLDTQIELLSTFKPHVLIGQTGGLYLLARELLRRDMHIPLGVVGPTGATLMPEMADAMQSAFGVPPNDLYGAIELGAVSWQCNRGNYHIDADRVVVEIVDDDDKPVPTGTLGHVVCTALYSYSMPFVRYRLLDIAALSTRTCDCGCRFPLMEPIQGRINDFVPTPNGDLVSPHFFFHLFDHASCNPVKEWRLIQEDVDDLTYEYIPEDHFDPTALQVGMDLIRHRFGPTTHVRAVRVDSVPCSPTGKRTCIVSRLRPHGVTPTAPWIRESVPVRDDAPGRHPARALQRTMA